jgi:hypothetical protein
MKNKNTTTVENWTGSHYQGSSGQSPKKKVWSTAYNRFQFPSKENTHCCSSRNLLQSGAVGMVNCCARSAARWVLYSKQESTTQPSAARKYKYV